MGRGTVPHPAAALAAVVAAAALRRVTSATITQGAHLMANPAEPAPIDGCCHPILEPGLSDDDAAVLARTFGALADPVRLRILSCIAAQPSGECCGCDLTTPLDRSQPTISHHLKVLTEAGLVRGKKRGRWVWYSLVPERVELLRSLLDASCCPTPAGREPLAASDPGPVGR